MAVMGGEVHCLQGAARHDRPRARILHVENEIDRPVDRCAVRAFPRLMPPGQERHDAQTRHAGLRLHQRGERAIAVLAFADEIESAVNGAVELLPFLWA